MKKYKDYELLIICDFIFIIISLFLLINVCFRKIPDYEVVQAEKVIDNMYVILLNKKYYKTFQKNQYVYVNSKKEKIEIIEVDKDYYKNYHKILLRYKGNKNIIKMSIYIKKKRFIDLFLECWEEDK